MIKFELSDEMVGAIGAVLREAPYKIVAPILDEMQKQIRVQQNSDAPKLKIVEPE